MQSSLSLKDSLYFVFIGLVLTLIYGCKHLAIDPSITSVEAGDYTLAVSACEAAPGNGMDICRVREGTKIESSWLLVVPNGTKEILGGEVNVYYRDALRSYGVTGKVIEIPWKDLIGSDVWDLAMDGEALALVTIRYKTTEGLESVAQYRGIAKLVVTKAGYDRLPIDSGYSAFQTTCKIQYSTSGRGAVQCN